jgi:hypothetical protein
MPNDAKLGFLVGVAGVVVAAVVFVQNPAPPAESQTASEPASAVAPPPAATLGKPGPVVRVALPAPTAPVSGGRKEVEGQTTARHSSYDDE